jgi:hypothetical protein
VRAELIAELKNAFNTEQLGSVITTQVVDPLGNPGSPIPSDSYQFPGPNSGTVFEQRKFQLGFRVRF